MVSQLGQTILTFEIGTADCGGYNMYTYVLAIL